MPHDAYISPFSTRYASPEMQRLFSDDFKFRTWRRLWIALARAEMNLGLPVTAAQVAQLEAHRDDVNYEDAERRERECRHDVMSHVYAYGLQCPDARGIIHLGATSCYVGDNTDVVVMREALSLTAKKLLNVIALLSRFAEEHKALPALAYTHLQPAQPTTLGKRAALWTRDFVTDYAEVTRRRDELQLLGNKGTTGTQASFVALFDGDAEKIDALEAMICAEMGFASAVPVSGQTYSRKTDYYVLTALSGVAQSAAKLSNDVRLMQSFKELEEPFEKGQIGSSAMAYKRNPMRCERVAALARYVETTALNGALTASTQWFERTLDDSANRRIAIAECFLGVDAILNILLNVCDGLVVYPHTLRARLMAELPFMATEDVLMHAVKQGGDRQALHERIRVLSQEAARRVKAEGLPNDLIDRLVGDPAFRLSREEADRLLDPARYTGLAERQTERYLTETVRPLLNAHAGDLGVTATLSV